MNIMKLSVLLLFVFGVSQAWGQCSNANLNGTLFFSFGGTVKSGSAALAHIDLGKVVADGNGGFTGNATRSVAGNQATQSVSGTYSVNADCSGVGTVTAAGSTNTFSFQVVNGGGLMLASVTTSTAGAIGEGRFYRAANATGSACGNGSLSGAYGGLLSGGTYQGTTRTPYDTVYQVAFDGKGGLTASGEVTSGDAQGATWTGTGTYSISADCSGTAQVNSTLGTLNYAVARVEGGTLLLMQTDPNTTTAGTATPQQLQEILPQLAFGGGWYSALYFTNTTSITQGFVVSFTADDGTPLDVPGVGTSQPFTIAPRGTAIIEFPNTGTFTQGYAKFSLPAGVTGYGVFRQSVAGRFDQEALVGFKNANATATSFTFDDTAFVTALALANPSKAAVTVTITARDVGGNLIGTATIQVDPGKKIANTLSGFAGLSGVAGVRGSALVTVPSGNVAVLALRFGGSAFTSIPTTQQQ